MFLASLSEQVGFASNADYYAHLVLKYAWRREYQRTLMQLQSAEQDLAAKSDDLVTLLGSKLADLEASCPGNYSQVQDSALTPISEWLINPPPSRDFLLKEILPSEIVGEFVAVGGTGKGFFMILMGLILATDTHAGPLKPSRKFRTLYLAGEDIQDELKRRTIAATKALWPQGALPEIDNFIPMSVMGKVGPLMHLDAAGNPVKAPAYDWLCKTLQNLSDVDVLIIDPKSKFYGLDENDNTHNAAWINCLESLVSRFKITVLFSHHESKAKAGSMQQGSSRGGSALTDGCRWVANLKTMDPKEAEKFQVADPGNFVVMDVTKSNYAPKLPAPVYFKRGDGGALVYANLAAERAEELAQNLVGMLAVEDEAFSRNDLLYGEKGKKFPDGMRDTVQGFNRVKDVNLAVDYALNVGWLLETQQKNDGRRGKAKRLLTVTEMGWK